MTLPTMSYLAVLVAGLAIFMLGGLWYSPVLFSKPWVALMGRSEDEMRAEAASRSMPLMYLAVFVAGLVTAWVLSVIIHLVDAQTAVAGASVAALCWLGFTGATSFGTNLFSLSSPRLWLINSGYNLVAMVIAGVILAIWR